MAVTLDAKPVTLERVAQRILDDVYSAPDDFRARRRLAWCLYELGMESRRGVGALVEDALEDAHARGRAEGWRQTGSGQAAYFEESLRHATVVSDLSDDEDDRVDMDRLRGLIVSAGRADLSAQAEAGSERTIRSLMRDMDGLRRAA